MDKLLLIDGNSLTYRAYFGSAYSPRGILTTKEGIPVNAVLTLNRMLNKAFKQYQPTHVLIAFDAGSKTVRHDKLESYKGGRNKTPDELIQQFPIVKEMISKMHIKHHEIDLIEADDIIASLAVKYAPSAEVIILSSDKDLFQLVGENISIAVPQNGNNPNDLIIKEEFYERFGYTPSQVKDFKGLVGDSSDNLPGVKGLGPKTAIKLLSEYKTLEGIYENIENISGKVQERLIQDKQMALLCKDLATLLFDVEVPFGLDQLRYTGEVDEEFLDFLNKYELNSLIRLYEPQKTKKVEKTPQKDDNQISFDNLLF